MGPCAEAGVTGRDGPPTSGVERLCSIGDGKEDGAVTSPWHPLQVIDEPCFLGNGNWRPEIRRG